MVRPQYFWRETLNGAELFDMGVDATILGGQVVHLAGGIRTSF